MRQNQVDLSERIAYAEDWLARARRQLARGDRSRGALILMLAEAEVHRARELGMGTAPSRPGSTRVHGAIGALVVAALVVGVRLSTLQPEALAPVADSPWPTVVALSDGSGSLLHLVQVPPAAPERGVAEDSALTVRVPRAGEAKAAAPERASPPAPAIVAAPEVKPEPRPVPVVAALVAPAPPTPAVAPAPATVQQPAPAVLSEADLIDLVLAAERSLRRSNQ